MDFERFIELIKDCGESFKDFLEDQMYDDSDDYDLSEEEISFLKNLSYEVISEKITWVDLEDQICTMEVIISISDFSKIIKDTYDSRYYYDDFNRNIVEVFPHQETVTIYKEDK